MKVGRVEITRIEILNVFTMQKVIFFSMLFCIYYTLITLNLFCLFHFVLFCNSRFLDMSILAQKNKFFEKLL